MRFCFETQAKNFCLYLVSTFDICLSRNKIGLILQYSPCIYSLYIVKAFKFAWKRASTACNQNPQNVNKILILLPPPIVTN